MAASCKENDKELGCQEEEASLGSSSHDVGVGYLSFALVLLCVSLLLQLIVNTMFK